MIICILFKGAFLETSLKRSGDAVPGTCFVTRFEGSLRQHAGDETPRVERRRRCTPLFICWKKKGLRVARHQVKPGSGVLPPGYLTIESGLDAGGPSGPAQALLANGQDCSLRSVTHAQKVIYEKKGTYGSAGTTAP
jgi:hypothetical protein